MKPRAKIKKELKRLLSKDKYADIPKKDVAQVVVSDHGPYIVVEVITNKGVGYMGVAKCSPHDQFDKAIGQSIALSRALNDYVEDVK